ncbi:hypothetical protein K503DRAFT_207871 [Rhizopogon vinicolor AM-OR11-026]|uniref:Uncharacterized protein n=1 Tax=Rhizopogon vinicolor AM-OR11-026 TaxID=1314800 RepID=A0A1B7MYZ6_9AGAM|nr:hypothetical protein K503DRAFT_207871 [Rhizopogon vinicolor AM-OR11-026]
MLRLLLLPSCAPGYLLHVSIWSTMVNLHGSLDEACFIPGSDVLLRFVRHHSCCSCRRGIAEAVILFSTRHRSMNKRLNNHPRNP